jgi:hypothetical protein
MTGSLDESRQTVYRFRDFADRVGYTVIVEMWDRRKSGRAGRMWLSEFDASERRLITTWYSKFYRWYLVTGPPETVRLGKASTMALLRRATCYFMEI